jgi:CRISPR-associated protein Cas6
MDDDLPPARLVDLAFPLAGRALPRDHRAALAAALLEQLPWLDQAPGAGLHRLHGVSNVGAQVLLSARARLLLRLPRERAGEATAALAGATLEVAGESLRLGAAVTRELLPHCTLYAHFVAAPDGDEAAFMTMVEAELRTLGVVCRPVCGRHQSLPCDGGALQGFSLMLDGLKPADALRVLESGVGVRRALGCGLFVPHRSAAAVGA